jgi:hypothetical protein
MFKDLKVARMHVPKMVKNGLKSVFAYMEVTMDLFDSARSVRMLAKMIIPLV